MSYHLYHSEAFVLGGSNVGESNRYYHIFTKELGLVVAFAQGVRELKSKLRYHLSDFSYASVSLIRGKDSWRVTSIEHIPLFERALDEGDKRAVVAALAQFLKQFLHGEEEHQALFEEVRGALIFLADTELTPDELQDLELVVVARSLARLGYLDATMSAREFIHGPLSLPLLRVLRKKRPSVLQAINHAIKESHL